MDFKIFNPGKRMINKINTKCNTLLEKHRHKVVILAIILAITSCAPTEEKQLPTLRNAFNDHYLMGTTLNRAQIVERDTQALKIIKTHFNSITAENVMKWQNIQPSPGNFNFDLADKFVAFGVQNDVFIIGHTLVWHSQLPEWVYLKEQTGDPANDTLHTDSSTLINRMKQHIDLVMGRYRGKIKGWDVVNEAVNEDGSLRKSGFLEIVGEEYIHKAFEFASEVDPDAELYYNDYNLYKPAKSDGVVRLVKSLQDQGIQVDGIGMQGHWGLKQPSLEQIEASILKFSSLGVKVMITELDIDVLPSPDNFEGAEISANFEKQQALDPYVDGLPDSVEAQLAERYRNIFELFNKHQDKISRVTFWGVYDGQSWKNNFPVRGRTNYPLLFNRQYEPRPAFEAVVKTVDQEP